MTAVWAVCAVAVYVAGFLLTARTVGPVRFRRRWDWNAREFGLGAARRDAEREARRDTAWLAVFWPITLVPIMVVLFLGSGLATAADWACSAAVVVGRWVAWPFKVGHRWALRDPITRAWPTVSEDGYHEDTRYRKWD